MKCFGSNTRTFEYNFGHSCWKTSMSFVTVDWSLIATSDSSKDRIKASTTFCNMWRIIKVVDKSGKQEITFCKFSRFSFLLFLFLFGFPATSGNWEDDPLRRNPLRIPSPARPFPSTPSAREFFDGMFEDGPVSFLKKKGEKRKPSPCKIKEDGYKLFALITLLFCKGKPLQNEQTLLALWPPSLCSTPFSFFE